MSTARRSPRPRCKLAALACAAGILGSCLAGCSGGGATTLSPEGQARAKAAFKKKSENYGRKVVRASR